jgi:prophage regulatory protein
MTLHPTTTPPMANKGTPAPYLAHSTAQAVPRDRILRLPDVESLTGLKKSTIYDLAKKGQFPRQILIHRRMAGWSEAAVLTWIQSRIQGGAQ